MGLIVSEVVSEGNGETLAYQVKQLEGEITPCLDITLPSSCAQKCVFVRESNREMHMILYVFRCG